MRGRGVTAATQSRIAFRRFRATETGVGGGVRGAVSGGVGVAHAESLVVEPLPSLVGFTQRVQ